MRLLSTILLCLLIFVAPVFAEDLETVSGSVVVEEMTKLGKESVYNGILNYNKSISVPNIYMTQLPKKYKNSNLANRKRRVLSSRGSLDRARDMSRLQEQDPLNISAIIEKCAEKYDVNPYIIRAIIQIESSYNPNALSYSGACGLMQLKPSTAKDMGIYDCWDPEKNIIAGTKYIKLMLKKFKNLDVALAAYNQGPGTVSRAGNKIPNATAKRYVEKFHKALSEM
ncbi:lytic transglycosylase domain-containing protein [bacterium]|nr:lytic transglycosylase domain-containing protein [bacterium]